MPSTLESLVPPTTGSTSNGSIVAAPHVHGLAWLPHAPDIDQVLGNSEVTSTAAKQALLQYVNKVVSTMNLPGGSNVDEAPPPKTNPHICNVAYSEVEDFDQDLADLIATCQRHTRCSAAYCLRTRNATEVQIWISQTSAT